MSTQIQACRAGLVALCVTAATHAADPVDYSSLTNAPAIPSAAKPLEPIQPNIGTPRLYPAPSPSAVPPATPFDALPMGPGGADVMPLPGSQPTYDRRQMREPLRRATVQEALIQQSAFRSQDVARAEEVLALSDPDKDEDQPEVDAPTLFNTPEADAVLSRLQVFPADNLWNQNISTWRVHRNSSNIVTSIGANIHLNCNYDMGFVIVPADQKRVPVKITMYPKESDPGPFPVPDNIPIEGWPIHTQGLTLAELQADKRKRGGDRHAIIIDLAKMLLHEFFVFRGGKGRREAREASTFDLTSNRLRPAGWTSADAAGLPIFPAVVRYDELSRGVINHALRVTVPMTRRAYVAPATHFASRHHDVNLPRMGERLRLRANYPLGRFSAPARTILTALQTHGMFVADNGNWFAISITPDERIPDVQPELLRLKATDFEVVTMPAAIRDRVAAQEAATTP